MRAINAKQTGTKSAMRGSGSRALSVVFLLVLVGSIASPGAEEAKLPAKEARALKVCRANGMRKVQ